MILTAAQKKAMEKAVSAANAVLPHLELLRNLADVDATLKARHQELRSLRDFIHALATTALHVDRTLDNGTTQ